MKSFWSLLLAIILVITLIGCGAKPPVGKGASQKAVSKAETKADTTEVKEAPPAFAIESVEGMRITILFPLLSLRKFGENPKFLLYAAYAYYDKADSTWALVEMDNYGIETSRTADDSQHLHGIVSLPTDLKADFFVVRVEGREENTKQILPVAESDMSFRQDESGEPGCEFGYIAKTGKVIVPVPQE